MKFPPLINGLVQIDPTEIEKEIEMAKKKNIRTEFLYDRKTNKTNIYIWSGMELLDTLNMNGTLSRYVKEKVLKEMSKRWESK